MVKPKIKETLNQDENDYDGEHIEGFAKIFRISKKGPEVKSKISRYRSNSPV